MLLTPTSYNPLPRERLMQIVSRLYSGSYDHIESHELSCVHTILALGHLMDPTEPADNPQVYHHARLGRLCLYLECIFAQTTVATIEAHLLRLIFLLFDKDQTAPMKVYGQLGLVWRLMISMGMREYQSIEYGVRSRSKDRDPARWNFNADECERRRRIFWEFVAFDTWQVKTLPSVLPCFTPFTVSKVTVFSITTIGFHSLSAGADLPQSIPSHSTAGMSPTLDKKLSNEPVDNLGDQTNVWMMRIKNVGYEGDDPF